MKKNRKEEEEDDEDYDDDEAFDEYVDQLMGEEGEDMAMMPMMGPGGDNMKFNIISTELQPNTLKIHKLMETEGFVFA